MVVLFPVYEFLHTKTQYLHVEGFGDIVISTQLQTFNATDISGACRQQNNGYVR